MISTETIYSMKNKATAGYKFRFSLSHEVHWMHWSPSWSLTYLTVVVRMKGGGEKTSFEAG